MTLCDRISGIPTNPKPKQNDLRLIGCEFLGEHIGGCVRAAWYKASQTQETNPAPDRLVIAAAVEALLRGIYMTKLSAILDIEGVDLEHIEPITKLRFLLDGIYRRDNSMCGIMIRSGSGYGFRTDVFGSKTREGGPKIDHRVQAWMAIQAYGGLDGIDIIYVDRDRLDDVCYRVPRGEVGDVFTPTLEQIAGDAIPACSYEKQWTDRVKVARLYAEKQISKAKYETWMGSGIGGDWHCEYCPYLRRCGNDG